MRAGESEGERVPRRMRVLEEETEADRREYEAIRKSRIQKARLVLRAGLLVDGRSGGTGRARR